MSKKDDPYADAAGGEPRGAEAPREPGLSAGAGRAAADETLARDAIWQDETFAVTGDGLAVKVTRIVTIIPAAELPMVGAVARDLAHEHADAPFVRALHEALMIHHSDEFPNGLGLEEKKAA